MDKFLATTWHELLGRDDGPLTFRLIMQPLMALFFAIRAGLRDTRDGRRPFFWLFLSDPSQRRSLLKQGWEDIGKLFVLAMILDAIYQFIVLKWIYPGQLLIVALVLAVLPYSFARGVTNRVAARLLRAKG